MKNGKLSPREKGEIRRRVFQFQNKPSDIIRAEIDFLSVPGTDEENAIRCYTRSLLQKFFEKRLKLEARLAKAAAREKEKRERAAAREMERIKELQEKNPYFVWVGSERRVELVLRQDDRIIGRFEGRAALQLPPAEKYAAFRSRDGNPVVVRDYAENGNYRKEFQKGTEV